eukprot:TRINITY_DN3970_c0_g1_i1.p1 TRINITY_DN3970_c0_g1~~TRINITY_DN3970_c0_g1_i1.p1  ORF type:complete len:283 (-),score=42.69 TRINITY_DN3970_c0_g1_i1:133-981(-)
MPTLFFFVALVIVIVSGATSNGKQSDYARICENPDFMFDKPPVCQEYCTLMERSCSEVTAHHHHQTGCSDEEELQYLFRKKETRNQCLSLLFGDSACVDDNCADSTNTDTNIELDHHSELEDNLDANPSKSESNSKPDNLTNSNESTQNSEKTTQQRQQQRQSQESSTTTKSTKQGSKKLESPTTAIASTETEPTAYTQLLLKLQNIGSVLSTQDVITIQLSLSTYEFLLVGATMAFIAFILQMILFCICVSPTRKENQKLHEDVRSLITTLEKKRPNSKHK